MRRLVAAAAAVVLGLLSACSAGHRGPDASNTTGEPTSVTSQAAACRCDDEQTCGCSEYWGGKITIILPARLNTAIADSTATCAGIAGSPWADVRANAPVVIRSGVGRVLARWKLPDGVMSHRHGECRFTLTQSRGMNDVAKRYSVTIGSHVVALPADRVYGNLFITLPNALHNKLIKLKH
jgi:hypothetical protein